MIYSHSRIETFKSCPKKFYYQYIEKPDIEKKQGIEAFLGSMVHLCLEKLYKDLKFTKLNSLDELLVYYDTEWTNQFNDAIEIVRKDFSSEHYKEMGRKFITNYYEKYHPFDQGTTLGLEMEVSLKFLDSDTVYSLTGFVDRLTMLTEKHFEIHDYKTNAHTKTQEEIDNDYQLALYSIAIKKMYPSVEQVDLIWHFLESGLEMRAKKSDEALFLLEKQVVFSIKDIEKKIQENDFPIKESALCDWCSFKEICPAKKHLYTLKSLLQNEYLQEKGNVLVSKFLELSKQKKELLEKIDPDLEKIKEALIHFSKENNTERVYDVLGNSLLIKEYPTYLLPEKGTKERLVLEKKLKELGVFELVSDVNSFSFSKAISDGLFDVSFLKDLECLVKKSKTTRIYPSFKK